MAVKFIENNGLGLLGCWEISENTEELLSLYRPEEDELKIYRLFRNELRRREWLAARLLVRQMTNSEAKIGYDSAGKPLLINFTGHISISHTMGFVVICYHASLQPGIDIELTTRNVERASRRFLSPKELTDCIFKGQFSNRELLLRWCAKEAVFKMVPFAEIDFARQIICEAKPILSNEGNLTAVFIVSGVNLTLPLQYRCMGNLLMVWGYLEK